MNSLAVRFFAISIKHQMRFVVRPPASTTHNTGSPHHSGSVPFTAQWRARYIGKLADTLGGGQDFLGIQKNGSIPVIPAFVYNDLARSYTFAARVTANPSVSNLFDKQPPLLYDAGSQDNTDIYTYDIVGRYVRLSLSAKF
jgi:outer membrane receptor protein involved in Fe transport